MAGLIVASFKYILKYDNEDDKLNVIYDEELSQKYINEINNIQKHSTHDVYKCPSVFTHVIYNNEEYNFYTIKDCMKFVKCENMRISEFCRYIEDNGKYNDYVVQYVDKTNHKIIL